MAFLYNLTEYWVCPRCGHQLIWGGDNMCSDWGSEEYENDDEAMNSNFTCSHCGAFVEVSDCPKSERHNYPAWSEDEPSSVPSPVPVPSPAK